MLASLVQLKHKNVGLLLGRDGNSSRIIGKDDLWLRGPGFCSSFSSSLMVKFVLLLCREKKGKE